MQYKILFIFVINLLTINSYFKRKPTSDPTLKPTSFPTTISPSRPTNIPTSKPSLPTFMPTPKPTAPTLQPSSLRPTEYDFKTMNYSGYIATLVLVSYTVCGCACIWTFILCCGNSSRYEEIIENKV